MTLTLVDIANELVAHDANRDPTLTLRQVRNMATRGLLTQGRTIDRRGTQGFPIEALYEARIFSEVSDLITEGEPLREISRALNSPPDELQTLFGRHMPDRLRVEESGANLRSALTEAIEGASLGERWILALRRRHLNAHSLWIKEWAAVVLPLAAHLEDLKGDDTAFLGPQFLTVTLDLSALFQGLPPLKAD